MNPKEATKAEILALAKEGERYCDLLIAQSDSWLPKGAGLLPPEETPPRLPSENRRPRSSDMDIHHR